MEIDIKEYLPEGKIQEIAEEELRFFIRRKLDEMIATDNDFGRVISDISYNFINEAIQKIDPNWQDALAKEVIKRIQDLSEFTIFRKNDVYDRGPENPAYVLLNEIVKENRGLLDQRVKTLIGEYRDRDISYQIQDFLSELINGVLDAKEAAK